MNSITTNSTSFKSTVIPLKNNKICVKKYLDAVKNCNLVSMDRKFSVEQAYRELFNNVRNANIYKSGLMLQHDKKNNGYIRFLGYDQGNDEYMYSQLKKVDRNARYVKDIPDDGYDHSVIELLV